MRAVADETGVRGPAIEHLWDGKVTWPFPRPFDEFRRLDPLARFVCIAAEALGVAFPQNTALVLATERGCLHADRRFEKSLHGIIKPAVFPYTLPSTCLGDLAIRHKIMGPVLCLSTDDVEQGLEEGQRLLDLGEAEAALVCMGDVVPPDETSIEAVYLQR